MKKHANMAEFAAELNLDRSTVSYILNDKWKERNISPKTVKRVKDYARKVNFVPNFFGRAIKGKIHSDTAILLPANAYHHHREAFFRLLGHLDECNLKYMMLPASPAASSTTVFEQLIAYNVNRVLLIASPLIRKVQESEFWHTGISAAADIQWLLYDCPDEENCGALLNCPNVGYVGINRNSALHSVIEYVKKCGYNNLLHYGFSPEIFRKADFSEKSVFSAGNMPRATDPDVAERLAVEISRHPLTPGVPQAVFINDDLLTISVISALQARNFRIPEDFAFISWDGLKTSEYFHKKLTTLEIPHEKMLAEAIEFLTGRKPLPRLRLIPEIRQGETLPSLKFATTADQSSSR